MMDKEVEAVFVADQPQVYVSKAGIKAVIYPGGLSPMFREFSAQ